MEFRQFGVGSAFSDSRAGFVQRGQVVYVAKQSCTFLVRVRNVLLKSDRAWKKDLVLETNMNVQVGVQCS